MSRFDELPADQRATLQLLLKQGKSYEELATLLRLEPTAVRERALDGLDALGPDTPEGLTGERQDEISDYLLGQQTATARAATRSYLETSAGGRAWARMVANEIRPLAGDALPEIPAEQAEVQQAFEALDERHESDRIQLRSSKLGGIILLLAIGVVVVVALVLIIGGGNDDKSSSSSDTQASTPAQTTPAPATTTPSQTGTTPSNTGVEQQINMSSPNSNAVAIGFVIKQGSRRALGISGQNFPTTQNKSFFYAVWLTGGSRPDKRLGFVGNGVGSDGKLTTGADPAALPKSEANAAASLKSSLDHIYDYNQLLITRENTRNPTSPGATVVAGRIQRPSGA